MRPSSGPGAIRAEGRGWPDEVPQLLSRCSFPDAGTAVVCAVSGGADSLAMLALAVAAGCSCHAVHIDHGLRPGSEKEAEVVAAGAASLGATFERLQVEVEPGPDLEARARAARYGALPAEALVGHTADDQAETLLLNLMRGSGLDGLTAMRPQGGGLKSVRRPILQLRRAETTALVRSLGLAVISDPSNYEPRFRRNRVRHELLPLFADISSRDPVPLLARTAALLADDACLLQALAGELDPTDTRALRSSPRPLAMRALRQWLRAFQGPEQHPPSSSDLDRVWAVVTGEARACELSGGFRVSRHRGRLDVSPPRRAHGQISPPCNATVS